jgi:N6-adenosine-specific RNA methylase IME4
VSFSVASRRHRQSIKAKWRTVVARTKAAGSVREQLEALSARRRKFGAILCDPPWAFKTYNEKGRERCPDWKPSKGAPARHYEVMSLESIHALPVSRIAADNSCLFLWVTWPMLKDALAVMEAWSFSYKTCAFDWMKINKSGTPAIGTGYWTRANTEIVLLGTRGKPQRKSRSVPMAILEPRREHSRKPDCVHDRIRALVPGPRLELFGRRDVPGWTVIGDQTRKFNDG